MKVSVEQVCELFAQVKAGRVTGDSLQTLLEEAPKLGASRRREEMWAKARAAVEKVKPDLRFEVMLRIAELTQDSRDFEYARELLHPEDDQRRTNQLIRLCGVTGNVRDFTLAEKSVRETDDRELFDMNLDSLSKSLVKWGDFERAIEIIERMRGRSRKRIALDSLVKPVLEAADNRTAKRLLKLLSGMLPSRSESYVDSVIKLHLALGEKDKAERLRDRMSEGYYRKVADSLISGEPPEKPEPEDLDEAARRVVMMRSPWRANDILRLAVRMKAVGRPYADLLESARKAAMKKMPYCIRHLAWIACLSGKEEDIDAAFEALDKLYELPDRDKLAIGPRDHEEVHNLWEGFFNNGDRAMWQRIIPRLPPASRALPLSQIASRTGYDADLQIAFAACRECARYDDLVKALAILQKLSLEKRDFQMAMVCAESVPFGWFERPEAFARLVHALN